MKDDVDEDDAGASSSGSVPESSITYGNPRASRNMAEKQRRDNLNTNISTMAALVPTVAGSSRRMDKISILRLAAAFLRTRYTLGRGNADFLPRQFNEVDLEQYIVDNLIGSGGFFIVVTTSGKIVYVSRQVEQQLGHAQHELLGQSLYNFIYPEDHEELTRNITPDEYQSPVSSTTLQITEVAAADNSNSSEDGAASMAERRPFREQRRNFKLRMSQRTISKREHTQYECLHISGMLRLADACRNLESNPNRARHRELSGTKNDIVFVGLARLPNKRPLTELSIIDANKDEYVTRHLVDGRIIYCDHRVSVVAGYLSEEVSGLSAFSFMHKDDLRWTMMGLRQMYDRAETCGSSCYRLLSKTGEFIYLRTHGYLEYDKDTQTVVSFVCINTLVSEEEGIELVKEMKERFSATVTGTTRAMIQHATEEIPFDMASDQQRPNSKGSLEDPSQLEDAITHLISDLPSPAVSEDRLSPSPMPNAQFAKAAIFSQRLPPAAAQASKIGIKKIDHYLVLQGKGNRTPKQESRSDSVKSERGSPSSMSMIDDVPDKVVSRGKRLEGESSSESGKIMHELMPETCQNGEASGTTVTNDADLQRISLDSQSVMPSENLQQSAEDALQTNTTACKVKIEQAIEILRTLEKREPVVGYMQNGTNGSSGLGHADASPSQFPLKRLCSDDDIQTASKRRHSDYAQADGDNQNVPYGNFVIESEFQPADFGQYNRVHLQGLRNAESPSSSLHEIGEEYQQLDPTQPLVANVDGDQLADLQDLKDDTLLSPGLDANPDLMMKIFDDLRPVMTFERSFTNMRAQQAAADDQAVSEEIRRTHIQLANSMALRESQFSMLARDLDDPALQAQRENLTQLQAEHKIQKQILKTLQQDHHNMQVNVKHNIGV